MKEIYKKSIIVLGIYFISTYLMTIVATSIFSIINIENRYTIGLVAFLIVSILLPIFFFGVVKYFSDNWTNRSKVVFLICLIFVVLLKFLVVKFSLEYFDRSTQNILHSESIIAISHVVFSLSLFIFAFVLESLRSRVQTNEH